MISIVIPLYNVERYIKSCLISLEEQYEKNFEVVIVNDGSTDNSVKIVENFLQNSNLKIKLINQSNKGASAARNAGIKYACGEYICFIDSDDMLDKNYLSILKKEIDNNNADTCICKVLSIGENDNFIRDFKHKYNVYEYSKTQALEKLLYKNISAGIWAVMCKRETLGEMKFAENFHYSEDLEMVWKIVASSKKIVYINAPLYGYRIRTGSAMSVINDKRIDGMKLFENLSTFIRENALEFYPKYQKYGVAIWVWSTLWQEAKASKSYREFKKRIRVYSPNVYLKKLYTYKNPLVAISSFLFVNLRPIYYLAIKIYKMNYRSIN